MRATALAIMALLLSSLTTLQPAKASDPEPIDCSNLFILLDRVLDAVTRGTPEAYYMIHSISGSSMPGELGRLHSDVYGLLLKYYGYTSEATQDSLTEEEVQKAIVELGVLQSRLPEAVDRYMSRLALCAHDPGIPATLRVSVLANLKEVVDASIPRLIEAISLKHVSTPGLVEVGLSKEVYSPGELIRISVVLSDPALEIVDAYLLTWPSLTRVSSINITSTPEGYVGTCIAPGADEVTDSVTRTASFTVAVIVRNSSSGKAYASYKLLRVNYRTPRLYIEAPATIYRGDLMSLSIYSDSNYSSVLRFGGITLSNLTLTIGLTHYYVDTSALNLSVGANLVEVVVSPTSETVGLTISKTVVVQPKVPKVEADVSKLVFTSDGFLTLTLISKDPAETPLKVALYVDGRFAGEYVFNGSVTTRVFTNLLPTSITDLRVVAEALRPGYEPYVHTDSVLTVNPLTTFALGLASVSVVVLTSSSEKSFMFLIRGFMKGGRVSRRVLREAGSILLEPYRISSRVADLYYGVLKELRAPPPEVAETLREHFTRVGFSGVLKNLLWRFLTMVEEDLYSSRRQDYDEALRLAEEVLRGES